MKDYYKTYKKIKLSKQDLINEYSMNEEWYREYKKVFENEFKGFLAQINSNNDLDELSNKIDWKPVIALLNLNFNNLWNRFKIPKIFELADEQRENFRIEIINSIKLNVFFKVFHIISNPNVYKVTKDNLNDTIFDLMKLYVNVLFHVFDFQYTLTSLVYNDDPKIIAPRINNLFNNNEKLKKFVGKNFRQDEIETFNIIISDYDKLSDQGYKVSYRNVCDKWCEQKHNYKKIDDLDKFYNRFLRYKKKIGI